MNNVVNKDHVLNGFKRLYERIDEKYLDMTIKQFNELSVVLEQAWEIVAPRKGDRRNGA